MQVAYEPWLVLSSCIVAALGGYVGFGLTAQVGAAGGLRKRMLLAGAAVVFAVAVWCMHFTGMLAARLPFAVSYLVFPALLSFLVCVILIGLAVFAVSSGPPTLARLIVSAGLMGIGVFFMHDIGAGALGASAAMTQAPASIVASLVIAMMLSGLALWLSAGRESRSSLILAAIAFAIAVFASHYALMAGLALTPQPIPSSWPAMSSGTLAIVVAVVAFGIVGIFLLLLVPDRVEATPDTFVVAATAPAPAENGSDGVPVTVEASSSGDSDLRRGIYAPLGGVGAPPPRIAEQLPIEREGATQFLPVQEVVAVHANAHYTFLFDGTAKLFCPLAIGEVESRLDRSQFMRVHRSHIVNIDRVVGYKKSGDGELVELAAEGSYTVPVSRSRAGWLKSRIKEKNGGSDLRQEH